MNSSFDAPLAKLEKNWRTGATLTLRKLWKLSDSDGLGHRARILLPEPLAVGVVESQHRAVNVVDLVVEPGEDVRERIGDVDAARAADVLRAELLHEIEEALERVGRQRELLRRARPADRRRDR